MGARLDPGQASTKRLAAVIALLGSSAEGERYAALDAALRLLAQHGLTFRDIAERALLAPAKPEPNVDDWAPPPRARADGDDRHWRRLAGDLLTASALLDEREVDFVRNVLGYRPGRDLSPAQRQWLADLHSTVFGGGAR